MDFRARLTDALKTAMLGGDAPARETIRMVMAKLKDADIAGRPKGVERIPDAEIPAVLRSMIKSRQDSIALYQQGNRSDLVEKEQAEIAVISRFLPPEMDQATLEAAVRAAIVASGAAGPKDMGKVMAALKAEHGAGLDMGRANAAVKAALAG